MTLGEKLKILREAQGWTQQQVSDYLHITRSSCSNYETGKRLPAYPLIVLLADLYHVSVDYLVRDNDKEHSMTHNKKTAREKDVI